eukprot:Hpha_TRINITY_DN35170_c0_g1::TRINITY_DN35170_c0_g1_i1::g.168392::m.168392
MVLSPTTQRLDEAAAPGREGSSAGLTLSPATADTAVTPATPGEASFASAHSSSAGCSAPSDTAGCEDPQRHSPAPALSPCAGTRSGNRCRTPSPSIEERPLCFVDEEGRRVRFEVLAPTSGTGSAQPHLLKYVNETLAQLAPDLLDSGAPAGSVTSLSYDSITGRLSDQTDTSTVWAPERGRVVSRLSELASRCAVQHFLPPLSAELLPIEVRVGQHLQVREDVLALRANAAALGCEAGERMQGE